MYEKLLIETERYLHRQSKEGIPVRKLWIAISQQGRKLGFSVPALPDYNCLLEGDNRFELYQIKGEEPALLIEEIQEHEELEKLGFLESSLVRLSIPRLRDDDVEGEREPSSEDSEEIHDLLLDKEELAAKKAPRHLKTKKLITPKKAKVKAKGSSSQSKSRRSKRK